MSDPNWFYSALAQSAAAIVGLIGAFVTSRVMMMAGEKSRIENRIRETNAEIKELERQNTPFLEYINEVNRKDEEEERKEDEESVNNFLRAKKTNLDLENLPTADEMLKELLKENSIRILDEKFDSMFREGYNALTELIRQEKEEEIKFKKGKAVSSKPTSGLGELFSRIQLPDFTYLKAPLLPIADPHKYDRYNKYQEIIRKNDTEISHKNAIIQELLNQLNHIVLPKHFKRLILSLIYFTTVGVILPLWLLPITPEQHFVWKPIVLVFFISGLIAVFLYIFIEIKYITKKTNNARTPEEVRDKNGK